MNQRLTILFFYLLVGISAGAQVSVNGHPVSWNVNNSIQEITTYVNLPPIDVAQLMAEDEAVDLKEVPYRFAFKHSVNLNTANSGRWSTLNNGDRVWMLGIQAENAKGLSVVFDHFSLPAGSVLHLYTPDKENIIGALTKENNKISGVLSTSVLPGNAIVIEYYEPYRVRQQGDISLRSIAQVYKTTDPNIRESIEEYGCLQNVTCSDLIPQSSSTVLMTVDEGTRWATGTLVNNANFDGKPYIITGSQNLWGDPETWLFTFNHQSSECFPSAIDKQNKSISGAVIKSTLPDEKLALLELSKRPLAAWDIFYAGWDISTATPQSVYSLHHPAGDLQKHNTAGTPTPHEYKGVNTWRINMWDSGSTESGSSGAPLFNDHNRLVGVMFGGESTCMDGGADYYSKLRNGWEAFEKYLNPFNQNLRTINGMYLGFEVVNEEVFKEDIAIFPNPAANQVRVLNDSDEPIQFIALLDVQGRLLSREAYTGQPVMLQHLPNGVYFIEVQLLTKNVQRRLIKN
jgi:lysyl endopeptidase